MLKWGALPQPYLQVTPLIRSTSNVIVQVYILIRGYQEQDQLNEITTKDHSKCRNIDTRAYLIFCYSFSSHSNFPPLRNAGLCEICAANIIPSLVTAIFLLSEIDECMEIFS